MPKYDVAKTFSVTVMHRGGNVFVRGTKGETIDLDAEIAEIVNADLAGALTAPKAATKKAPTKKARQITNAPNRSS